MNLLFYIDRYPGYGGIESVTTTLANFLSSKKDISVSILSFKQEEEQALIGQLDTSVQLYRMPINGNYTHLENQRYIQEIVTKNKYDYIICQDNYAPMEDNLFSIRSFCSSKIIIVEHSTPDCALRSLKEYYRQLKLNSPRNIIKWLLYPYFQTKHVNKIRKRHRGLLKDCDHYVFLSSTYVPIFQRITGISDNKKIHWLANPINYQAKKRSVYKDKTVLFVGRFTPSKGIDKLIRIWEKLYSLYPEWTLKLVGDGVSREELEYYVKINQVKNVRFEGYHSDVEKDYERAAIFCMCSSFEGLPLVLIEAMSKGCVPIAYDSFQSLPDIIDTDLNGYIIPSFNEKKYIHSLNRLMSSPDILNKMSEQSRIKSAHFHVDKIGEQWIQLLQTDFKQH